MNHRRTIRGKVSREIMYSLALCGLITKAASSSTSFRGEPQFSLDVFVSGYATSRTDPKFKSRSERTVMRLAKGALLSRDAQNS